MPRARIPIEDRICSKLERRGTDWLWTGAMNKHTPVLKISRDDGSAYQAKVPRVIWEIEHGEIPVGKVVLRECGEPRCVRPHHLCLVDAKKPPEPRAKIDASPEIHDLAVVLSNIYHRQLLIRDIRRRWSDPVEEDPVYRHFVNAAKLVGTEHGINPRWFIRAQFECWYIKPEPGRVIPKRSIPQPNQLYSENALNRYNNWTNEYVASQENVISYKTLGKDRFKPDDQYLRRLAETDGVGERRALIRNCTEFSMKYLKHKGVWEKVKDRYIAWKEDTDDPSAMDGV